MSPSPSRHSIASALGGSPCLRLLVWLGLAGLTVLARAQSPATATLTGVVANAATRQFLENAQVRLDGTNRMAATDRDGTFRLEGLPPGNHTLTVTYFGLDPETRPVALAAGGTTRLEFNLTSKIYQMDTLVVAAEVEGNAAELNRQRLANVLMNSVSTDALGVVPDGNIGEFLKYMPGLQVNYSGADANTVSVRGQDPESTVFTFDGQIPAAAGLPPRSASGSSDASSRAFEFSQASIDNIESIEFFKAPPPWMPPSTGGVVNAVTRNAFAQKGRRITTVLTLNGNSDRLTLKKLPGPGRGDHYRITPGGRLNYSEAFLGQTLGLSLTYGESHVISPSHNNSFLYMPLVAGTTAAPATAASPEYINSFTNIDGADIKARRNVGLNADYKLGRHTILKVNSAYNYFLQETRQHTFRVRSVVNTSRIRPGSNTTDTTIENGQVDVFANYSDFLSQNYTFGGAIEHRWGAWRLDCAGSYAKSDSRVIDLPEMINSIQVGLAPAAGVGWRITAAPDVPAPLSFEQIAGPDLYNLASYNTVRTSPLYTSTGALNTSVQAGSTGVTLQTAPRWQNDRTYNFKADLRRQFSTLRFPVELRAGASYYKVARRKSAGQIVLWFAGRDGIPFSGDEDLNAGPFAKTEHGDKFLYGLRQPPLLDPFKVADYMKQNPGAFRDLEPGNAQRRYINSQNLTQVLTAEYVAGTVQFGPKFTLVGGVRSELTENFARGAARKNSLGAGLIVNSYEWNQAIFSQTQRATSSYRDLFPNLQGVYRFSPNLLARAAISKSMSRPGIQSILPNTTVNDTAAIPTVTVNNTALAPTYSNNLDLQLELYTRPSGSITVGWFKKDIENYIINEVTTVAAGADNGFDGLYAGYRLNTQDNGGKGKFEGLEVSARQQLQPLLAALPEPLRGWEVFANYTKNYKGQAPNRSGVLITPLAPNFYQWNANYGISYTTPARRVYVQARTVIYPAAITSEATATDLRPTYLARQQRWDVTLRYRLSPRYAFELTGANIFNASPRDLIKSGRTIERREFGATYALSFIGNIW